MVDYEITLRPLDTEDGGGWVALVPDLPGCSGDGETPEQALHDVEQAMMAWMEHARELGRPIPEPNQQAPKAHSGKFTLRLPVSMHRELEGRAEEENVSINQLAVYYIAAGLGAGRNATTLVQSPRISYKPRKPNHD